MRAPRDFFGFHWLIHENPCFLGKQHKSNTRQLQIITRQTQFITRPNRSRPGTGLLKQTKLHEDIVLRIGMNPFKKLSRSH